jgi:peptidoglycan/xylan/chitin deacetylase (PgdA/CDA1 family)
VSKKRSELERLLAPLAPVPVFELSGVDRESSGAAIASHDGGGDPRLLRDGYWHVFARPLATEDRRLASELAVFTLSDGSVVRAGVAEDGSVSIPFSLSEAYDNYVSEAWRTSTPTRELAPSLLNAFYRVKPVVPRGVQLAIRRAMVRWQRRPAFPAWPWDDSLIRLLKLYVHCALLESGEAELPFRWFWPHGRNSALTLGHDVESQEGMRLAIELADVEEELGFRSVFNFGGWYELDSGIIRELTERGFEIGVHGVRHDRSLFRSRAEFDEQLPALAGLVDRLQAEGFRSPSTYRVFDWLAELPIAYDASISHSDPFEPQAGGSCSVWPFFIGPVVELPYTLPQDHTLFNLLNARSVDLWLEQANRIERNHGLIHCVSHPDRGYLGDGAKRAMYAEFLRAMADRPGLWRAVPRDIARWWRLRDQPKADQPSITRGVARRGESPRDVVFECAPTATSDADLTDDLAASLEHVRVAPVDEQAARIGP